MSRRRLAAVIALVSVAAVALHWLGRSRPLAGEYVGLSAQRLPIRLTVAPDRKTLAMDVSWCHRYCGPTIERTVERRSVKIAGDGSFSWEGRSGVVNTGTEEFNRLRLRGRGRGENTLTGTWRVDRTGVSDESGRFQTSTGDVAFRLRRGGSVRQPAPWTDASGNLVIPLDGLPSEVAVAEGRTWVLLNTGSSINTYTESSINTTRYFVIEIDPRTGVIGRRTQIRDRRRRFLTFAGVAAGEGAVWLAGGPVLARVDARTRRVSFIPKKPMVSDGFALGAGALWHVDTRPPRFNRLLLRSDPRSGRTVRRIRLSPDTPGRKCRHNVDALQPAQLIAVGARDVWVTSATDSFCGRLSQIDPRTNRVTRAIALQHAYHALAVASGGVWAVTRQGSRYERGQRVEYPAALHHIDPRDGRPTAVTSLPEGEVHGLGVSRDTVWISQTNGRERGSVLLRVDRVTGALSTALKYKGPPSKVAVSEDGVWTVDADGRVLIRIPL